MHGLGNDFVVVDRRGDSAPIPAGLTHALGDRHTGVGFDQLVVLRAATREEAAARLEFFNPDGSASAACGNGTRCAARLLIEETHRDHLSVETGAGLLACQRAGPDFRVNMGHPQRDWAAIPLAYPVDTDALPLDGTPSAVGMGNPHCIFFVPDADAVDLAVEGPRWETHPLFPERTNVEFVHRLGPGRLRMRVWERGGMVTRACGSGACAVAVAASQRGLTGRRVSIQLDGGALEVDWAEDGVWTTGPASRVFNGEIAPEMLA
ncbi:MAG: diaminopimelate epimerase [Pseudomonadota bacterium]